MFREIQGTLIHRQWIRSLMLIKCRKNNYRVHIYNYEIERKCFLYKFLDNVFSKISTENRLSLDRQGIFTKEARIVAHGMTVSLM